MTCDCIAVKLCIDPASLPGGGGEDFIPDLRVGVETKWPVRYQGKQVYAQLVECGNLPNNTTRTATHGIPDIDWAQISWDHSTFSSPSNDGTMFYCPVYNNAVAGQYRVVVSTTNIEMRSNYNASPIKATVCILYTKITDQPVNP